MFEHMHKYDIKNMTRKSFYVHCISIDISSQWEEQLDWSLMLFKMFFKASVGRQKCQRLSTKNRIQVSRNFPCFRSPVVHIKRSGLAHFSRVYKMQQIRKISILMRFTQRITQVWTSHKWESEGGSKVLQDFR